MQPDPRTAIRKLHLQPHCSSEVIATDSGQSQAWKGTDVADPDPNQRGWKQSQYLRIFGHIKPLVCLWESQDKPMLSADILDLFYMLMPDLCKAKC